MKRLHFRTLAIISLSISAGAQQLTLRFDPLTPAKGTSVSFVANSSGAVSAEAISTLALRSEETQNHKYILAVDTSTFQRDKFHRFSFDAYLRSKSSGSDEHVQKFRVVEDPNGAFPDGMTPVTFSVEENSGEDRGTIRLPIHSDDGSDNVLIDLPTSPQKVSFSGSSPVELGLSNKLDLPVDLAHVDISSIQCQSCWSGPLSAKPNITVLSPHKGTSLIVSVHPDTLRALGRSILSVNPNISHDTLLISVASVAEDGGLVTTQEFKLQIRFAPPALYLFGIVIIAAFLGALAHLLFTTTGNKWRELFMAFIIAILVWLIALVLFSLETRVTIFGFSLDPTQLIPAGLIAFLSAGGPPLVSKLKEAFGRDGHANPQPTVDH